MLPILPKIKLKMSFNEEQDKVIETLAGVLQFLKAVQIKNEESFNIIKKPLDNLLLSLKYLPVEDSFNSLPTELKTRILSYTCDNGAFVVASVCQEWENILQSRLTSLKELRIGKHCSNEYKCENFECFMPKEMLKASITLELDVPLLICHPLTDVDAGLIANAVTDASEIIISDDCICESENEGYNQDFDFNPIMTHEQLTDLFEAIENKNKIMECVYIVNMELNHLNQDRLANCFINKTRTLYLDWDGREPGCMLNIKTLISKLLEESTDTKLELLNMSHVKYPDDICEDFADALCKVETIELSSTFPLKIMTAKRLIENILTRDIKTKLLYIEPIIDWRTLINLHYMKIVFGKIDCLELCGRFTSEQLEVCRSVPEVQINSIDNKQDLFRIIKVPRVNPSV